MAVSIRDAQGSPEDRKWIQSVYRDYLNDLAMLNTGIFPVLGEFGHREPDLLARWFADDRAHPLLILKSETPAGFALVVRPPKIPSATPPIDYRMSEFFVLAKYRRLGIGRDAAQLILNRFAGQWEVTEYLRNAGAVGFWRSVIGAYTRGQYTERIINGEVRQLFRSATGGALREGVKR
ncbi:MAG TPA: GNAT family N-acetyltransferase [Steroidobacteraceae bacterium]|nr:GNAT family N-acetyltransferase [Steroidobacteraceae bacterium]